MRIIGDVTGSATASNTLPLVALGDCSVETVRSAAYRNVRNADAILNMEAPTRVVSVLSLSTPVTTTVTGEAVEYAGR